MCMVCNGGNTKKKIVISSLTFAGITAGSYYTFLLLSSMLLIVTTSHAFAQSQSLEEMITFYKHSDFIKEFESTIQEVGGLKGIATDSDGNAWFYHSTTKASTLVKIDTTMKFTQYGIFGNTTVHDFIINLTGGQLVFDKSRNLIWFTDARTNSIGKFDIKREKAELIGIPTSQAGPMGLILSPDNKSIWFAELTGSKIGRLNVDSNKVTEYFTGDNSGPTFLAFDETGTLWVTLSYSHNIVRLQTDLIDSDPSKSMSIIPMSNQESPFTPFGIAVLTDDGKKRIFVSDHGSSRVISFMDSNPDSFTSYWTSPSQVYPDTLPGQIVADKKGTIYFPEHGGNRIAKIDPTGLMTEYDIPTGPLSTVVFLSTSDDGNRVWFTELLANRIAYLDTTMPVDFNLKVNADNQLTVNKNLKKTIYVSLSSLSDKNSSHISLSNVTLDVVGMTDYGLRNLKYDIQPQKIDLQNNASIVAQLNLVAEEKAISGQYTVMVRASAPAGEQLVSELYPVSIRLESSQIENQNTHASNMVSEEKTWFHDLVNLLLLLVAIALIGYLAYTKIKLRKSSQKKEL